MGEAFSFVAIARELHNFSRVTEGLKSPTYEVLCDDKARPDRTSPICVPEVEIG